MKCNECGTEFNLLAEGSMVGRICGDFCSGKCYNKSYYRFKKNKKTKAEHAKELIAEIEKVTEEKIIEPEIKKESKIFAPIITDMKETSDDIWSILKKLNGIKKNIDSLISDADRKFKKAESELCNNQHNAHMLSIKEEDIAEAYQEYRQICSERAQAKKLKMAYEVVRDLTFGENAYMLGYGDVFNYKDVPNMSITYGEDYRTVKNRLELVLINNESEENDRIKKIIADEPKVKEYNEYIEHLHETKIGNHISKFLIFEVGNLDVLKKLVEDNNKFRAFRVVGNKLNCYN